MTNESEKFIIDSIIGDIAECYFGFRLPSEVEGRLQMVVTKLTWYRNECL